MRTWSWQASSGLGAGRVDQVEEVVDRDRVCRSTTSTSPGTCAARQAKPATAMTSVARRGAPRGRAFASMRWKSSAAPGSGAGDTHSAQHRDDRRGWGEEAGEAGEAGDRHHGDEEDPGGGTGEEDLQDGRLGAGRFCKPLVDKVAPPEEEGETDPGGGQRGGQRSSQDREAVERLDAAGAGRLAALERVAGADDVGDEPGERDEDRDGDRRGSQARSLPGRVEGPERQERPDFRPQQRRRRPQPEDQCRGARRAPPRPLPGPAPPAAARRGRR